MSNPIDNYNKIVTTVNSVTSDYTFDVDANNLIVIDTSNNRIGINTVYPQRSIHISGGNNETNGLITPYIHLISGESLDERSYGGNFKGSIIPDVSFIEGQGFKDKYGDISGYNLGDASHPWQEVWCMSANFTSVNIGPNTLFMNGKPIIGTDELGNIRFGNPDQNIKIDAAKFNDISLQGDLQFLGRHGQSSKITSDTNIIIDPSGIGDNTGLVTIMGNLLVLGQQTTISSETLEISDNIITLNKGYNNNGPNNFTAGIEIENGSNNKPQLLWVNDDTSWKFISSDSDLLNLEISSCNVRNDLNVTNDVSVNGYTNLATTRTNDLIVRNNINFNDSDIVAKIRAKKNSNIDTLILEASNVEISNNIGLIIPVGNTDERESVNPRTGTIRFNSSDTAFEGYDGANWGALGGVKDVSQTTLIRAENYPGANNKQLDFITHDIHRMQIDANGDFKFGDISNQDIKFSIDYNSGDVSALKIESQNIVSNQITVNNLLSAQNISAEHIIPKTGNTYSLGDSNNKWKELYLDSSGIYIGNNASITKNSSDAIILNNTSGNFTISGNLAITGNLIIPGENIQAGGQLIANSHIISTPIGIDNIGNINRDEALFTTLDVKDESVFKNDITIYKDKKIKFANQPGSDTTNLINGEFDMIEVSNNSIFKSNLTVQKKLFVEGDVSFNSNLFVANDVSFNNNVEISNNLIVKGDAKFNSNVYISNDTNHHSKYLVSTATPSNTTDASFSHLLSVDGYVMTRAIVHIDEDDTRPAAIVFGDGSNNESDKISLITYGVKRIFIENSTTTITNDLSVNGNINNTTPAQLDMVIRIQHMYIMAIHILI